MMNRRQILAGGLGAAAASQTSAQPSKKKVAAVVTMYTNDGRLNTHANVIIGRLLDGYSPNGVFTEPRTRIVSMYTDQVPPADLSRGLAEKHGFRIFPTIQEALTLGGDDLAVDAVCFVGEHGNYPTNDRGQKLYPRYELMERIVEVFRRTGKVVPVFCDKHFSYSWLKAKADVRLVAGPEVSADGRVFDPADCPHSGSRDTVGRGVGKRCDVGIRRPGRLRIPHARVHAMYGGTAQGRRDRDSVSWSGWTVLLSGAGVMARVAGAVPLLEAAFARDPGRKEGRMEDNVKNPVAFLIEYKDGLKAVAYMINGQTSGWTFAAKLKGKAEPLATHFGQPRDSGHARPLAHFDGLVHCMEEMFITGKPLYPGGENAAHHVRTLDSVRIPCLEKAH